MTRAGLLPSWAARLLDRRLRRHASTRVVRWIAPPVARAQRNAAPNSSPGNDNDTFRDAPDAGPA